MILLVLLLLDVTVLPIVSNLANYNIIIITGVNVHGVTRNKDLVETLHKSGVCISYEDTLLLYDYWALLDVEASRTCPQEIADSKPAIVIVDNDDFKIDTMTGSATGAHRTNVMYVQPEE